MHMNKLKETRIRRSTIKYAVMGQAGSTYSTAHILESSALVLTHRRDRAHHRFPRWPFQMSSPILDRVRVGVRVRIRVRAGVGGTGAAPSSKQV